MEQLNRKLRYWEYSHERQWREYKAELQNYVLWFLRESLEHTKFWASFLLFLKLKVFKNILKISQWSALFFLACVSSRALRLQRQPGEHILSEDLYRQLNESVNYSSFLK